MRGLYALRLAATHRQLETLLGAPVPGLDGGHIHPGFLTEAQPIDARGQSAVVQDFTQR
jgi:hypothetical protein